MQSVTCVAKKVDRNCVIIGLLFIMTAVNYFSDSNKCAHFTQFGTYNMQLV